MKKIINLTPIKKEILTICKAFNLGDYKRLSIRSENKLGFIFTEFETTKGIYYHYFKID